MEQQQPSRRSLLILVAVAIVVVGVLVVKSLPKQQTAPAARTPSEHLVAQSVAAVPGESTRHGSGEEALSTEARQAQGQGPEGAAVPPSQRQAPKPEAQQPTAAAAPAQAAVPEPTKAEPEQVVEPLPGSKLGESLGNGKPTMVDFGAGWCQQCKMMEPVLKESARKYQGTANVVYVDTDKFPQTAHDYKITAIPTQIFFDASGKEAKRHMGYWPIEEVAKQLAALGVGG